MINTIHDRYLCVHTH